MIVNDCQKCQKSPLPHHCQIKKKILNVLFSQNSKMLVFNSYPSHVATRYTVRQRKNNRFQYATRKTT